MNDPNPSASRLPKINIYTIETGEFDKNRIDFGKHKIILTINQPVISSCIDQAVFVTLDSVHSSLCLKSKK